MKNGLIISLTISIIIILSIIAFQISRPNYSPSKKITCNTIAYNGEGKSSILFFASEKTSKQYYNELFSYPPFNKIEEFNAYYTEEPVNCSLYKNTALLCNSKSIIQKAASCPSDYIIVIKDESPDIRSSTYSNILSLNNQNSQKVIVHEFGHAFASLADEYVPASLPKNSKNCAKNCDSFEKNSCFDGCSKSELFRSIDSGIMRSLSAKSFGSFDESIINSKIAKMTSKVTGNVVSDQQNDCENQKYYLIEGNYSDGNIEISNQSLEHGCAGKYDEGEFNYSLVTNANKAISSNQININIIFTDIQNQETLEGGSEQYSGPFTIRLPYNEETNKLLISYDGKTKQINLQNPTYIPCPA